MTSFLKDGRSRPVALWLFATAFLVFAMVVVGGATRLTGSGLSITQWKPVTGALPPLSEHAWQENFRLYQATPQYRLINRGMSLGDFKFIYWWEWSHRLLGRLLGAVFAVPFVVFLALRRLPARLVWRCVVLFALGGLQGLVGWWMVKSGLEARVTVAPERLATHLGLALILFCALVWTGLEAWSGQARVGGRRQDGWSIAGAALMAAVYVQCLLGALVAGNQAGLVDNDWPLMNGRVFPDDYAGAGAWQTFAHSQAAVQFNHRLMAYAVLVAAGLLAVRAIRARYLSGTLRSLFAGLLLAVLFQASLGIATLMTGVPLWLAILHQAGAVLVLTVSVILAWRARRA
ncbi:COX15/CtaA family protein [Caulobacter sp. KR2-114]|uniref:COX15/CtaA family protein n=1 Tax=Caulobacter sp. KR2-114 TaxID=3400912 RepID=UPI003BFC1C4C